MVGKWFADKPKINVGYNIPFNPYPNPTSAIFASSFADSRVQGRELNNTDKFMIYPELKHILSPDIDDLESYFPEDPESFGFSLQLLIGPKDQVGEESFEVMVCTPQWLSRHTPHDQIVIGRH